MMSELLHLCQVRELKQYRLKEWSRAVRRDINGIAPECSVTFPQKMYVLKQWRI